MKGLAFLLVPALWLAFTPASYTRKQAVNCQGETHYGAQYTYAGVKGSVRHGISAVITAEIASQLDDNPSSHVAAWVGVDFLQEERIQVGISTFGVNPAETQLYYETSDPSSGKEFSIALVGRAEIGRPYSLAVLEMAHRPGFWRAWIDGKPVSPPFRLPRYWNWFANAVAESRRTEEGCNTFSYKFSNLREAKSPGGPWQSMRRYSLVKNTAYEVNFGSDGSFIASSP